MKHDTSATVQQHDDEPAVGKDVKEGSGREGKGREGKGTEGKAT